MAQAPSAAFDLRPVGETDDETHDHRGDAPARLRSVTHPQWRLSVHTDLAAIESLWRAFQATADGTVFQTYEWLSTWQRHVGARSGTRPFVVVVRNVQGGVWAMIPLAIEARRGLRTLTWLGSDLCDYNAPLLDAGFVGSPASRSFGDLWRDILKAVRACDAPFDLVSLSKMPERVGEQPNPFLQLGTTLNPSGAYLTKLAPTWDDFYKAARSSGSQKRDRQKRRKLAELGEVQFVSADAPDEAARALDTLMRQKAASFAAMGVPNIFERPGWSEFYRALAIDPEVRAISHISRLDVGAVNAALNLGFIHRGRYYHVLASYEGGDEVARFGPGAVHLQEMMRHAIERGCTLFDFTIGDEPYKREWSDQELALHDHLAAASLQGALRMAPMRAALRLKRTIKQTPVLWRMAVRVRELLAKLRR